MRVRISLLIIGLFFSAQVFSQENIIVPLQYQAKPGIYTAKIIAGPNNQEIDVLVDTGSSLLVVMGDKAICPTCNANITATAYQTQHIDRTEAVKKINYLTSAVHAIAHTNNIGFDALRQVALPFNIIVEGVNSSNILGLSPVAQQDAAYSLWQRLTEKYNLERKLTFILCGDQGKSFLIIGKLPSNIPRPETVSYLKGPLHYGMELKNIVDAKTNSEITNTKFTLNTNAVLDTGSGGLIVMEEYMQTKLLNYIREYIGEYDKKFPPVFWTGRVCIEKKQLDLTKFPTLKLNFYRDPDAADANVILTLPPQRYINTGGCGNGKVRFAFIHYNSPQLPGRVAQNNLEKPSMIMGTPVFEQYGVVIMPAPKNKVFFFSTQGICK